VNEGKPALELVEEDEVEEQPDFANKGVRVF
jgi:hypothetical protein